MDLQERAKNLINKLDIDQTVRGELLQLVEQDSFEILLAQIRGILEGLEQRYNAEISELEQELEELERHMREERKGMEAVQKAREVEEARKKLQGL
jgi:predicted transcriptional regulator with HTH domain